MIATDTQQAVQTYLQHIDSIFKPEDTLCFVSINHTTDATFNEFVTFETARSSEFFQHLQQLNETASVYVGMNAYKSELVGQHKGRTKDNVIAIRTLYYDADKNGPETVAAIDESRVIPPPSIILESSPGKFQGVWLVDDILVADAKSLMQAVAQSYGTDGAVADTARVLRVPGLRNLKYAEAPEVRIVRNSGVRYGRGDFKIFAPPEPGSNQSHVPRAPENLIRHGAIHPWMLSEAGKLRNMGLSFETLEPALQELVHANCEGPIDTAKVRAMAQAICGYAPGGGGELSLTQTAEPIERPSFTVHKWPQFPDWVLPGTSLYDNFVQPICAVNSRVPYFLWYPAMVMMMNYLGTKVTVWGKDLHTNLYLILVGRKGKLKKSSSVQDSMRYLEYAGVLGHCTRDTKMASGKSIIWTAGSIESVGIGMEKTATKNAILFYDEFGSLAAKAGIEGSNLSNQLLTTYESNKFANSVKSAKESFSHEPGTYAFSLIACNTRNDFAEKWAKFAKGASGMEERFSFVLQPEELPPSTPFTFVSTQAGATITRQLIDKALAKGRYHIYDPKPFADVLLDSNDPWSDREEIRAEKYALYFAIDLGLDDIDEECVARALAVVQYEREVKEFLKPVTANNAIAAGQISVRLLLERNGGEMSLRDLLKQLNAHRHGTGNWYVIYDGLIKAGIIQQVGTGKKGDPKMVQVLEKMPADDDD